MGKLRNYYLIMTEVPFPNGAKDGTVFFHDDKVCVYSEALNTWEVRKVVDPNPIINNEKKSNRR